MAIFTGKIVCNYCGKFFIRKNERGRYKWVCQRYDNLSECQKIIIDEESMKEFISRRLYPQDRIDENVLKLIEEKVEKITVEDKHLFKVLFKNDEPMYRSESHIYY